MKRDEYVGLSFYPYTIGRRFRSTTRFLTIANPRSKCTLISSAVSIANENLEILGTTDDDDDDDDVFGHERYTRATLELDKYILL